MRNHRLYPLIISMAVAALAACHTPKKAPAADDGVIVLRSKPKVDSATLALQTKYAALLGVAPSEIRNVKLYRFIDEWLGVKYKWGGTDKRGVDCSSFVQQLLKNVYGVDIPRVSETQFLDRVSVEAFRNKNFLAEGDLLFFHTLPNSPRLITHVGLYLGNDKFVNSSSTAGVSIADLGSDYWRSRYRGSGRFRIK